MTKSTGTFSRLLCALIGACCIGACSAPQGEDATAAADSLALKAKQPKRPLSFDSLRQCMLTTDATLFDSLRRSDLPRWQLAADLLGYYYSIRWSPDYDEVAGPEIDAAFVGKRLEQATQWWSVPKEATPYAQYTALRRQAEQLTDFATSNAADENLRLGLKRFMQQYLDARCRQQLEQLPQAQPLAGYLRREREAWYEHLQTEEQFMQLLYRDSLNLVSEELGRRIGTFLETRQERRAEADRNLLFALSSGEEFKLPREEYVTWAVTMGQYEQLQSKYSLYGATHLKQALAKESAAWFRYMQVRTQIEDWLGESDAGKVYDTTTRILKRKHLNDLKTW